MSVYSMPTAAIVLPSSGRHGFSVLTTFRVSFGHPSFFTNRTIDRSVRSYSVTVSRALWHSCEHERWNLIEYLLDMLHEPLAVLLYQRFLRILDDTVYHLTDSIIAVSSWMHSCTYSTSYKHVSGSFSYNIAVMQTKLPSSSLYPQTGSAERALKKKKKKKVYESLDVFIFFRPTPALPVSAVF